MLADLAKKLKEAAAKKDQAEQTAAGRSDRGQPQPSEDVKQAAEELADKLNNSQQREAGGVRQRTVDERAVRRVGTVVGPDADVRVDPAVADVRERRQRPDDDGRRRIDDG